MHSMSFVQSSYFLCTGLNRDSVSSLFVGPDFRRNVSQHSTFKYDVDFWENPIFGLSQFLSIPFYLRDFIYF